MKICFKSLWKKEVREMTFKETKNLNNLNCLETQELLFIFISKEGLGTRTSCSSFYDLNSEWVF